MCCCSTSRPTTWIFPTLEILEESLLEYPGALVLVTHDRYLLDRISTTVLGLDGFGSIERFADYPQWEAWQAERKQPKSKNANTPRIPQGNTVPGAAKKKLAYLEAREYADIEERVAKAEEVLQHWREVLVDPAVATDAARLQEALAESDRAQEQVDALYARWAELEAKLT